MVVDHGPIKYLISKIRYDEQESPKPNSTYLESFLRQHEENKPRLYLRRIQGLESLHLIHDSGLNPIFKDDLNEKDGVYIYDSEEEPVDEVEKKDEEGDFEIRSFVNINDLETIRKYRNTNFIITGRQVSQRKFRKEKMSLCQRRNKRLQTEVRDADAPYATDVDIALESEIVDESLEDIAIKRYEEIEQQVGRKVKVDTWKGKGVKSICLCNTKKYQVVKGKFGNKSVKVKLTVNRNTRNAAGSKQKMRVCLCNLAKKIIETTAELTTAQNKDALSKTLTGILDTLADDGMSNGENGVTVSPTKLVDPIDVEEIENFSKQKICICKKRKKNVSLKIIRKNSKKSTVMLDAQTEIPDSIEDDQNVFDENDGEKLKLNGDEKLSMVPYEDAIDEYDETYYVQLADKEQDQEKLESNNEVPEHIDGSQNLQVVENKAKGANQDKLDKKSSLKKRARVCLCNRKIKNVAIKITKTMAFGRAVRAGDSSDLKEGQTVEETKLDRSYVEIPDSKAMKETTSKAKSLRKKMICLCEKRLKDLAIKIIRATSQPSSKKHIHVFKRKWTNNPKKLEYRKKVGPHIPDEGTDVEMRKMKWRKKKKKLCFCEFHLESIDEEMHIREELPGPIEKTNSIEKHSERDILESKTSENSWHEIFDTGEKYDRIKEPSLPNLIAKKITQSSLQEVLKPTRASLVGVEEKSQPNISFIECSENNEKDQSQEEKLATAVNQTQDDIKAGKQWVARSLTNISATVKEHSLEDIQLISRTNEGNNHDETIGSTMVKTQPTKNEENYSSEGQKIGPQQLKPGSEANVDSTRKLKQKKKVCFCEDILKKQILEDPGDLPASSDRLGKQEKVDRSNQEVAKSRSTNKPTDVHYDNKGNEDEIAIRERYVAEFSYEKYQEMQGLVDELLESDINGFENTHGLKEASKISDESKELPNITSCKKRCEAAVDQNRSINSKKPETAEATKDAIADTEMKQNKKACRYICNHLETAFYDIPSVIGLIASNELLSVCNEQEFEVPDTRTCNEPVYKVLYASDLKPIIEESYEEESKLYDKDQKSTEIKSSTKQYRRTMNSIKVVQNDKTCTRISDCYKNMICNRLSSLVLLDSDEHLAQSVASAAGNYFSEKLLDKITSDQSTQTKERNFIKNHSLRSTSTDEAFKRRSKSSLVGLWDSDGNFSLNTDYVNGMSNSELKATNDKFNERLTKTKGSKKANKFSQTGHFYEEQDYGTTINKLLEKKASLMILLSPDNHFETSKKKGNEIYRSCGTSYSTGSWKKGNINRGNRRKLKTCVARDVGCNIEECKENKPLNILSDQESQSEDVKFTTKSISTGVSTHIVSNQNKKLCIDRRSFEKYKVVSKHSLSRFTEPCQHFTDTEQVSETSDMTELKSTARHLKEGILNDGISRKPKRRRSVIDTITKYIAGAEKQIKKPFKKIGSYTEDAINKSASAIKSLDLGERLMSSVKQMVEMHISSEKKSDTNECKNLYDKNSGHISQAKKINLIKDQISAKITSCRISHDQQNERCKTGDEKASDGSMFISSNDRLTDIADKSRKVSNLAQASDYKNCSAKRRSCKGTQIKKAVITNQSVKTQRLVIYLNKKKTYS